jgi:hypothetical protein
MQFFVMTMFCCVTLADFLVQQFGLPPLLRFAPEALSGFAILYVFVTGTRNGFRLVAPKYWLILAAIALVVVGGAFANNPGSGPMVSGMRFYFRAAPFFFLPMVMSVTERRLRQQLFLLLTLALLELPLAVYQRWSMVAVGRYSGDPVRGTIMDSGTLSMLLICGGLILTGLMLKKRVRLGTYVLLFLILLFPTTINETKATVLFVPFGLLATLLLGGDPGTRVRYASFALVVLAAFGAIFVPVYDKFEEGAGEPSIEDFFSNQKTLSRYLISQGKSAGIGIGGNRTAHRGESITIPMAYLAKDPVRLAFGLGLGSVSPSRSGEEFEGRYYLLFHSVLTVSFSFFLLEFGLFGILLIALLQWMILADAIAVARHDNSLFAALAAGWVGAVAIFAVAMFYSTYHYSPTATYLYWYLAGVVCARRRSFVHGGREEVGSPSGASKGLGPA